MQIMAVVLLGVGPTILILNGRAERGGIVFNTKQFVGGILLIAAGAAVLGFS